MNFFGLTLTRQKALSPVPSGGFWNGLFGTVRESFSGAWQRNITAEPCENLLTFSPVFAAITLIANDIAKLRLKLTELEEGIWKEIVAGATAFLPVIRKPNRFQTRAQFVACWILSKLLHGNTYVFKVRDDRNVVVSLFILDPRRVTPLVADDGAVFYRLMKDALSEITEDDLIVPADELIHDRMNCLWHPLVGVSPLYGCGKSATQGMRIQTNSAAFFENMSRPSGVLTAPAKISDETAARLKAAMDAGYSGANMGKTLVAGDGLKYEAMTIPALQSQLREQLDYTVEDVARAFHIPLYMLQSGAMPALASIGAIKQDYYSQALQYLINDLEDCLTEGLGLGYGRSVEFDLDDLMRLDPLSRAETSQKAIGAGYLTPNEARAKESLAPVPGGDTPYLQQQYWSLAQLDGRDMAAEAASAAASATAPALPEAANDPNIAAVRDIVDTVRKDLENAS